ncbi:rhomboid family intramembrane serine protease [Natrialbaceae archaeon GCM10025810]|uniref:rhomboid family intramembrane serine protease n=1 Tax=Halovalidus salilacus TaxID=3075124 RepID=UPI0036080C85
MLSRAALVSILLAAFVVGTVLVSLAAIRRLLPAEPRWRDVVRSRFVLGVPWGSLVVIGFVLSVYLFVQDGITNFDDPVSIPYRAWSYYYPLGMVASSFSHASAGHLIGNLTGAAILAPIAEYAWGHYPPDGSHGRSDSAWDRPWVRALVIFPLGVIAVGLVTSLLLLGPVIGFSGLVFAFVGFAIVRYPIVTLIAYLGGNGALRTIYDALSSPIAVYVAEPSPPSPPSWANVAIQGHALGFLVGFLIAILVFERRDRRPNPLHLWLSVLFFGFASRLWAIYWYGSEDSFILFRGPGVVVVTVLSVVVTLAVTASDAPLVTARLRSRLGDRLPFVGRSAADPEARARLERAVEMGLGSNRTDADDAAPGKSSGNPLPRFDRIRSIAYGGTSEGWLGGASRRSAAFAAVLLVLALITGPAIPVNLFVADGEVTSEDAVDVEDYTIFYDEGVENELSSVIDFEPVDDRTTIESSGVIVTSDERHIWLEAASAQRLEFTGEETVYVGGPGWREAVHVERGGWEPVGNDTVYQVWLREDGEDDRRLSYASESSRADVRLANATVSVAADDGEFRLEVDRDPDTEGPTGSAPIPDDGESTVADGITFERDGKTVYAVLDGTEVRVASEETYE